MYYITVVVLIVVIFLFSFCKKIKMLEEEKLSASTALKIDSLALSLVLIDVATLIGSLFYFKVL